MENRVYFFRQTLWDRKMAKPYSVDLRKRVLEHIEETKDQAKASELFKVVWPRFIDG